MPHIMMEWKVRRPAVTDGTRQTACKSAALKTTTPCNPRIEYYAMQTCASAGLRASSAVLQ
ncbi:hypothetical protein BWQ96_04989 [Gracilariopsis chorda]|uniref:Uncharacterized protein n=1 Tax=Gracilariopsis chorda TaxID=448386 RepID=A0A2V3ISX6_9FLOR|nr:hypothetical protein BWQ96_04989 [Gracilariopsis chorda]|eukprot:PXF45223.1 hypothetical protein BWQ96_04989 [Gracilariopsis chorda]